MKVNEKDRSDIEALTEEQVRKASKDLGEQVEVHLACSEEACFVETNEFELVEPHEKSE